MTQELFPYFFALGANLCFATATIVFTNYSREISPLWINAFKSTVALLAFLIVYALSGSYKMPTLVSAACFFMSGLIGLNIGDWFLMKAFAELGASRALMLFGFQPLILGTASYFLFQQEVDLHRLIAIFFLIACLFTFSLESFKKTGHWGIRGLIIGFIAISLDACGVLLTRYGFNDSPEISSLECNLIRCLGAIVGFVIIARFRPIHLKSKFLSLTKQNRVLVLSASLLGTFVSLFLYLAAVQRGHLASVSAIAITGPLFAAMIESLITKKPPSLYLVFAFALFATGFLILVL